MEDVVLQIDDFPRYLMVDVIVRELDLYNVHDFKKELLKVVRNTTKPVVLKLETVQRLDSSALGMFVSLRRLLDQEDNARLILAGLSPTVSSVVELFNMAEIFSYYKTVQEALQKEDLN